MFPNRGCMRYNRKLSYRPIPFFLIFLFSFLPSSCIDPVSPEFEYREGLLFIEGFASTVPGASFVVINESSD